MLGDTREQNILGKAQLEPLFDEIQIFFSVLGIQNPHFVMLSERRNFPLCRIGGIDENGDVMGIVMTRQEREEATQLRPREALRIHHKKCDGAEKLREIEAGIRLIYDEPSHQLDLVS